jgi:hypothetical protein
VILHCVAHGTESATETTASGHVELSPAVMRATISPGGSCSHARRTVQPAARKAASLAASRFALRSSFGTQ